MRILKAYFFLLLSLALIAQLGCGYTFQGSGSVLPQDVKKIYVPLVENNTPEAGLDRVITEALQDQFERYGTFYVVDNMNDADAVLKVRVLSIQRNNRTTSSGTDSALQVQSVLNLSGELRRVSGPVLWANPQISQTASYGAVSGAVVANSADFSGGSLGSNSLSSLNSREVSRSQEGQVLETLAEQAARAIYQEAVLPEF
jgi:hypothetical protein